MSLRRTTVAAVAAAASVAVIAGCSSDTDGAASASATTATPPASPSASPSPSASASASAPSATPAGASASTSASASTDAITEVQLTVDTSDLVAPDTLQYRYGSKSFTVSWKAISGADEYPGTECAAVITLTAPNGDVVKTDRSNECAGRTNFTASESKYGVGDFTVNASIAPWSDPDVPTVATKTLHFLKEGA